MNQLDCGHRGDGNRMKEYNAIPLKDDTVLVLCDNCAAMVKASVLEDMVKESLTQVFKASVADSLK